MNTMDHSDPWTLNEHLDHCYPTGRRRLSFRLLIYKLAQPWLLWAVEKEAVGGGCVSVFICLPVSLFPRSRFICVLPSLCLALPPDIGEANSKPMALQSSATSFLPSCFVFRVSTNLLISLLKCPSCFSTFSIYIGDLWITLSFHWNEFNLPKCISVVRHSSFHIYFFFAYGKNKVQTSCGKIQALPWNLFPLYFLNVRIFTWLTFSRTLKSRHKDTIFFS